VGRASHGNEQTNLFNEEVSTDMTTATNFATVTLDVSRIPEGWAWTIAANSHAGVPFFTAYVTYPKPTPEDQQALECQLSSADTPQAALDIALLKAKGAQK
jgi:hypothetical protein